MAQPPSFVNTACPTHVCKLRKAIYWLRQAPRAWCIKLWIFLLQQGFLNSKSDTSLLTLSQDGATLYLLVYVNDIIIIGSSSQLVNNLVKCIATRFSLKDLRLLYYFLGIEAITTANGLFLCQQKYIKDLLIKTQMLYYKTIATPISTANPLCLNDGSPSYDARHFHQTAGALQYLALTRPDVCYVVNNLSQFMHRPTINHWKTLK